MNLRHLLDHLPDRVFCHIVVLKGQRAAHAAAHTGISLKVGEIHQLVVLHLFKNTDDIVNSINRQAVPGTNRIGLPV